MTGPDIVRDPASFRDPTGFVFEQDGRIRRAVTTYGLANARQVRATGLIDRLVTSGALLPETEVATHLPGCPDVGLVLEHPRLPFISYPYEWPFRALQAAALLHLDIQREALEAGVMLSDATAYNVQFVGARPVFIDHLSFRPYREGEVWAAHRQFCEQFLHPLLLGSVFGVEYQPWYRGRPDGIPGEHLVRLLRLRHALHWKMLVHVVLPARLQRVAARPGVTQRVRHGTISRAALGELWRSLRRWVADLRPRGAESTTWAAYDATVPSEESDTIARFVEEFTRDVRPRMMWDLGCNAGRYGETALAAGAEYVVGVDSDAGALDRAFLRAHDRGLALQPLLVDITDPTPEQGWAAGERRGLLNRGRVDAVLALAVVHHIAISRNVPLDAIVNLLIDVAPEGVIGFVPNTDARAQALFKGREDMFRSYTLETFAGLLARRARIVRRQPVPGTERVLLRYSTQ
jgi:ribosomal protein L11 methylase PrmA